MGDLISPDRAVVTLVAFQPARERSAGNRRSAAMGVQVGLLGGFSVVRDEALVPGDAWRRRHAAQLVQLLALSRDRRMHREQVVDALWPGLPWDEAAPRLHKAAHYARRALDDPGAVVLRHELVTLFPDRDDVEIDVDEFSRSATRALRAGDEALAAVALQWYGGPLLAPGPPHPWAEGTRPAGGRKHPGLLRLLGRGDDPPPAGPA